MLQNDPEDVPDMLFGYTIRFYCLMIHAIHLYTPEQKNQAKYLQPGFYYIYLMNGSPASLPASGGDSVLSSSPPT